MRLLILHIFLFSSLVSFANYPFNPDSLNEKNIIIDKILLEGNKITKPRIIHRELLFSVADIIPADSLEYLFDQSRKNLINTSLFNFVNIDILDQEDETSKITVRIKFVERWYIWPVPIFEFADRNFNSWWEKKDLSRLNYGFNLVWNNFRGRREKVEVYSRFGYDQKYLVSYKIPYINKKQTWGTGVSAGLSQNHEVAYNSEYNKEVYFKSESQYPKREVFAYIEAYNRKGIHNTHWVNMRYSHFQFSDSLLQQNPDYSFGNENTNEFISVFYQYRTDFRDYKQYPVKGYYFDATIEKKGLGLINDAGVNDLNIIANVRKYFHLGGRFYYATGITGKTSPIKNQPYFYQQGLGYGRNFVRGYEYYVIDGQHFGLWKNNLKFELVKMRVFNIPYVPSEKFSKVYYAFYLNIYSDLGFVWNNKNTDINPLSNKILNGTGIGLDFVTYYDLVIRFEYSFNIEGDSGFFIHFMPSI
jgi:hypothetical protein